MKRIISAQHETFSRNDVVTILLLVVCRWQKRWRPMKTASLPVRSRQTPEVVNAWHPRVSKASSGERRNPHRACANTVWAWMSQSTSLGITAHTITLCRGPARWVTWCMISLVGATTVTRLCACVVLQRTKVRQGHWPIASATTRTMTSRDRILRHRHRDDCPTTSGGATNRRRTTPTTTRISDPQADLPAGLADLPADHECVTGSVRSNSVHAATRPAALPKRQSHTGQSSRSRLRGRCRRTRRIWIMTSSVRCSSVKWYEIEPTRIRVSRPGLKLRLLSTAAR